MTDNNNDLLGIKEEFAQWCKPRRGKLNPETMTNIVWSELIQNNYSPYKAHKTYGRGEKQSPGWCFSRYGQSKTILSDGTIVYIAGEHEDYYDEDFYIYNDVIVKSPDSEISIFGYSPEVFPPTDSHSATLVGENIYIIGCIGYPEQRDPKDTPVYILSLEDYSIKRFETSGAIPNWLYGHDAIFASEEMAIYCDGGKIKNIEYSELVENIATWRLCLRSGIWTCVSRKPWSRWRLAREDGKPNKLYELGNVADAIKRGRLDKFDEHYRRELEDLNYPMDFANYRSRYSPPIEHIAVPNDDYRRYIIGIDGVNVRYDEDRWDVTVTVEGVLPEKVISVLKSHGLEIFSKIEAAQYKIIEL